MILLRCLVSLVLGFSLAPAASGEERILRIHGSNTIGERLAPALAEAWLGAGGHERIERFAPAHDETTVRGTGPDGRIDVELRAHGSSTGFAGLLGGHADLAMASRPVNADEVAQGRQFGALDSIEQEAVLALDGIAVIVHPSNPVRALRLPQLRAIFSGEVRDWSRLGVSAGRIALHARDANSGTWDTFRSLVLGEAALHDSARRFESTLELARAVSADPAAIGFVGLAAIGEARAVPIADGGEAMAPTAFGVAVEDYPLARRLYFYRAADASPLARAFVEFALSDAGQAVVERNGFVSQRVRSLRAPLRAGAPAAYRTLVDASERLSLNFRFGSGSSLLDSKAQRDLDRLATFMREPGNRDRALTLLGFSDANETVPYLAVALSNDRVDFIAGQLERRGIAVQRSRGLGGIVPISREEDRHGRQRNRRVEVWLQAATGATVSGGD